MCRPSASLLIALMVTGFSFSASAGSSHLPKIELPKVLLATNVMYGVDGPFVGDGNPVRGIPGDDLPWESPSLVDAKLTTDGFLFIIVRGLVLGADDVVPEDMRLVNPDKTFRGVVSCLTEDTSTGTTPASNVFTKPFKADAKGNSLIVQKLELPNPCVAPIIMILAGDRDEWFAMTGHEGE
jgi:hypothetical protein